MNLEWGEQHLGHHHHHQQHGVQHHHNHGSRHQPSTNEEVLHSINYDTGSKSTKEASTQGASKMRRDSINGEVMKLRDLLPLPASTRQRLSQLQLMALICVYVRKTNFFDKLYKTIGVDPTRLTDNPMFGFSKALNGFVMMITQTGKLLYISENASEYLGHSMEDLLIHGDSIYDIIDKQDHPTVQAELLRGQELTSPEELSTSKPEDRIFLCRMNVSRNARRQMRFGDQKVILVEGHFYGILPNVSRSEPVFVAWCTPVAMPETRECVVQGATNIFTSVHSMDLKISQIDSNGEHHLGYSTLELNRVSYYHLLHPDSVREVAAKHRLITQSESDRACILLIRLQRRNGSWLWVHTVLQVKDQTEETTSPVIVCTSQILSLGEAEVMKANSWLYHYYMVQSRLQYGLAYGAHSPAALSSIYYPHVASQYYEPSSAGIHPAYLQAAQLPYPHYAYPPTVPYYHPLPPDPAHILHPSDTKDPSQAPLDFSKNPPSWESGGVKGKPEAVQHWDYLRPQDLSSKSPSWKSDSSGSPLERVEAGGGYAGSYQARPAGHHYPSAGWLQEPPIEPGKLKKEVQEVYSDRNNNPHCL